MGRHAKTLELIETARSVLENEHPMTVRQVYYQLVSRQVIKNNRASYQAVSKALVAARRESLIPWAWIEDRLRRPRSVSMWGGLSDFAADAAASFRLDVWLSQPSYLEVWLEKDALSGIFEDILDGYGVTLNVGRGYDGWDSIHNASERLSAGDTILYFGDFDPSGEDMVRSLRERLGSLESKPTVVKCALTADDIERYSLPPDFAKATDSRRDAFVAMHGDVSVELDALPSDVLRNRLVNEVQERMDKSRNRNERGSAPRWRRRRDRSHAAAQSARVPLRRVERTWPGLHADRTRIARRSHAWPRAWSDNASRCDEEAR